MKLRYENGDLEIDLNNRGSNFLILKEDVSEDEAEEILAECEARDCTELHEVVEVLFYILGE